MKTTVLLLALLVPFGMVMAQSGQTPPSSDGQKQTPVTYNPQNAPPANYSTMGQFSVIEPAQPGAVDLSISTPTARSPSMPDAVDIPTGPASVSQPGLPTNNYGPAPPDGDGRLMTTPMVGNGAPAPVSNTYPEAPTGSAPQPPTCDKICY